jgi:ATP-binding cassette subfamily B protein
MSNTPSTSSTLPTHRAGTARTILRILPWVRPALPRIILGMGAALLAGLVSLAIPLVLQNLVDGPLSSGDGAQIWPAALIVLLLGVLEAGFIAARWPSMTAGRAASCSRAR